MYQKRRIGAVCTALAMAGLIGLAPPGGPCPGAAERRGGQAKKAPKPKSAARKAKQPAKPKAPAPVPFRPGTPATLRAAVEDLMATFGRRYPGGKSYLARLADLERRMAGGAGEKLRAEFVALQREALLANPLLDFDRLLLIKRKPVGGARRAKGKNHGLGEFLGLPRQSSWQLHTIPKPYGWENEIAVLNVREAVSSPLAAARLRTLFRPPTPRLVSEMDLNFDGDRILFSMPGSNRHWQVFEMGADGSGVRQVTPTDEPDVHSFDACYLPNGKIAFISTATLQAVPCNSGVTVGMTYLMDGDGKNIRQLCFDQDHNFCPTVMPDGRILFLRWEYTDLPHAWARILFTMNPDGTGQKGIYGGESYWPNGIWYARPIPGSTTKIVGIVTGHHVGRAGQLVIFDTARGQKETAGVVQRIGARGRPVEPIIMDRLTMDEYPAFLHPLPLGEMGDGREGGPLTALGAGKYFLVSCKPAPDALWGIYLVDVFDNFALLAEEEGYALFEPVPLRPTPRPPVIPDKVNLARKDAVLYVEDVYAGPGLKDVPRGAVRELRLFTYHFAYQKLAGIDHRVGAEGPWEPKLILGTVPVEADGSAMFRVPANMPISIQPLGADGGALQLMRSWTTAMPGEVVSCVGCHERTMHAVPNRRTIAAAREAAEIRPWRGPLRGFSFRREVQPVLDKYCVACHDGSTPKRGGSGAPSDMPDLRGRTGSYFVFNRNRPEQAKLVRGIARDKLLKDYTGVFERPYYELRRFVRVGGLESDIHLLNPGEFHANTSELVQMLRKGHHGVRLDEAAWDRLTAWIDLNAPCHGTWRETVGQARTKRDHRRRMELFKLYGTGRDEDPESVVVPPRKPVEVVRPAAAPAAKARPVECANWPFDAAEARRRQAASGASRDTIDLGGGLAMKLVLVPAGQFVMGQADGCADERPLARVRIDKPFWMGKLEVTNRQYARFDPAHDSRFEHGTSMMFHENDLGPRLDRPDQPAVRLSWRDAAAFCRWLSGRTGRQVRLPTEAQWEYACRAGTAGDMSYGDVNADFSRHANMADVNIRKLAFWARNPDSPDLIPRDGRRDDGVLVTADVGRYRPNAWGLHDMHGNVWEWTRSGYRAYPYRADDGRNRPDAAAGKVVRGGSWYDRPKRCRSAFRLSYPAWQRVYNVGFRVVVEADPTGPDVSGSPE